MLEGRYACMLYTHIDMDTAGERDPSTSNVIGQSVWSVKTTYLVDQ